MRAPSLTKIRSRCRSGAWWPWCLLWVCCVPFAGSITRTQLRRELGIEVITVSATPASVLAACLCAQHARICGPARRDHAGAWWCCSSRRETTAKISLPTAAAYAARLFRRPTRCGTAKNIASHHRAHPSATFERDVVSDTTYRQRVCATTSPIAVMLCTRRVEAACVRGAAVA